MTAKEAIKDVMWEKRYTQKKLAEQLGFVQSAVSNVVNRGPKEPRIDTVVRFVNAMGCEVIVRDPSSGLEWKITRED